MYFSSDDCDGFFYVVEAISTVMGKKNAPDYAFIIVLPLTNDSIVEAIKSFINSEELSNIQHEFYW